MKITTKTTKEEMTKYLGANASAVQKKDKSLFERLQYASKMFKKDPEKVTRKDLVDLVKDTVACLAPTPVVAEASLKKSTSLKKGDKSKKSEETSETSDVEEAPKSEEETAKVDTKKSANKTVGKKNEPKKSGDASLNKTETTKVSFKDEFEVDGAKYQIAHDIKSMEDLYKALEAEEVIVFAFSWTKSQIKQFRYFEGQVPTPKSFPQDLDLATCIYASDAGVVAYAVSMYTEANYCILPVDFEEVDNIRYCAGIEYQLYRQTE